MRRLLLSVATCRQVLLHTAFDPPMSASYCGGNEYSSRDRSASTPAGLCRNPTPLVGRVEPVMSGKLPVQPTRWVPQSASRPSKTPGLRDLAGDAVPAAARRRREITERDRPPPRPDRLSYVVVTTAAVSPNLGDTTEWFERSTTEIISSAAMPARTAPAGVHRLSDRGEKYRRSGARGEYCLL